MYKEWILDGSMQKSINLSIMLFSLLLLAGCHHIYGGYGIPTYMQPKGFSMTYKEYLYSTPVGVDCPPTYLQQDSELANNDSEKVNTLYHAQKVKGLIEGETFTSPPQPKGLPHAADAKSPVRLGRREMSPVKSKTTRRTRRF